MGRRALATLFVGPQGLRAGWGLLLFAVTLVGLTVLLALIVPHGIFLRRDLSDETALFLAEVLMLAGVVGATVVMAWAEGRGVLSYGLRDRRASQGALPARSGVWRC